MDHKEAEEELADELDWPLYYVCGDTIDKEDFVPAYYKVEGPNGPVSYMNPNTGPYATTMFDFAMEAQSEDFRMVKPQNTPWVDSD